MTYEDYQESLDKDKECSYCGAPSEKEYCSERCFKADLE